MAIGGRDLITIFKEFSWCLCIFLIAGCAVRSITNTRASAFGSSCSSALGNGRSSADCTRRSGKTVACNSLVFTPGTKIFASLFHRLATKPAGTDRPESDANAIVIFASVRIGFSRCTQGQSLYFVLLLSTVPLVRFRFSRNRQCLGIVKHTSVICRV